MERGSMLHIQFPLSPDRGERAGVRGVATAHCSDAYPCEPYLRPANGDVATGKLQTPTGLASVLVALVLAVVVVIAGAGTTLAAGTETIRGSVVNGTAGAPIPNGLVVTLLGVGQGHQMVVNQTATVGEDGHFSFAGVPADPNVTYVVSTEYAGVPYLSAIPKSTDVGTTPVELKIYETTTSDAAIKIDSANWLLGAVDVEKQQATVLEMLVINNDGDRTYVGDHRGDPGAAVPGVLPRTLRLALPQGAGGFQAEVGLDPSSLLPVANGFVDTAPVLPGQHQIAYTFHIGYAEGVAEVQSDLPYPTTKLRFLAPDAGLGFRSDRLGDGGTVQLEGRTYRVLAADQLPANATVTVDVVGLPAVSTSRLSPEAMQVGGVALIVVALALSIFLGLRSRGIRQTDLLAERRALLASIARLDDQYAAGQLPESRYREERVRQKRQLLDLMFGGRAFTPGSGAA